MQYLDDCVNPVEHLFYVGVNTGSVSLCAADTPAHSSNQIPLSAWVVHQRAPTISLEFKTQHKP